MSKPELLHSISILSKKIDSLLDHQKELNSKIAQLEDSNKELSRQHINDSLLLKKAYTEIEFLKVSHRLASSPESIVAARTKLSKLIRTIDSCIRMINED